MHYVSKKNLNAKILVIAEGILLEKQTVSPAVCTGFYHNS